MDVKSGYPYWAIRNGLYARFPSPTADLGCDVAVIGGGITGALIARELAMHGHDTVVLERRDMGWGSTAGSTAMLQYEIDTPMIELARRYGEADATLAYRSCAEAIPLLQHIAGTLGNVGFRGCDSLYLASRRRDLRTLRAEHAARRRIGLKVDWLAPEDIRERFGIDAPAGLLSRLAARVDPYRFSLNLLKRLQRDGTRVHELADVVDCRPGPRDVRLRLANDVQVRTRWLVVAAGYETQRWLRQRVARNRSSYAYVSDPVDPDALGRLARTLVWETARPYLYLRTTDDHRLVVGGEDDAVDLPARRDRAVCRKAQRLQRRLGALRPDLVRDIAFAWGGTFAETEDGLPWFGPHASTGPRILYAMAYGGNGITYSAAGASLLRGLIERKSHPLRDLYGFARLARR